MGGGTGYLAEMKIVYFSFLAGNGHARLWVCTYVLYSRRVIYITIAVFTRVLLILYN